MRLSVRMKKIEGRVNTTRLEPPDEAPPMDNFYVNTEALNSILPAEDAFILHISDTPFAEGEVTLALPPVPFYKLLKNTVRYEHRVEKNGKDRRVTNTPALPVTLSY